MLCLLYLNVRAVLPVPAPEQQPNDPHIIWAHDGFDWVPRPSLHQARIDAARLGGGEGQA